MTTPTLDDDRIETMRQSVMHTVDQGIKRRGRRLRNTIGLSAASVLVVGLGGYAISSIDSQSSSGEDSMSAIDTGYESSGRSAQEPAVADNAVGGAEKNGPADEDREVITFGDVNVTVKDPRTVAQQLSTYVESIGGRVDNRSENGTGADASAVVTVRVPSEKVTATIDQLEGYGTVDTVNLQNDDVTAQARDLDARIDALSLSIDRLETIMADSDTSGELIKAESALTQRQEQLESLQAERNRISDQVSLSTLTVDLSQGERVDSVEPGGFTGGLKDGWNALVSTVNHVVEVAGTLLPWAAILIVIYGIYRLVARRRQRT